MLARVRTAALWGVEAFPVECEVDLGQGLPGFILIGHPDTTVREAKERIWPALRNAGFALPDRRVTVNLAPAERRKEGASADLAIALGVLLATSQAPPERLEGAAVIGELALDGAVRAPRGVLALAEAAWRAGVRTLLCAREGAPEAALIEGLSVLAVDRIEHAVLWLRGEEPLDLAAPASPDPLAASDGDLAEVRGQLMARRALEISGRVDIRCCWSARRARASRCSQADSPASCRRSRPTRRSWSRASTPRPACAARGAA